MSSSATDKAEIDALIAQLGSTRSDNTQVNVNASGDNAAAVAERKRVQIRRNSGSNSNSQLVGSPTDVHGHLLQKNAKISKKYNRKSRQGKGRGLAKKGGGGGGYTWGLPGSELLEEYSEDLDEDELADLQYNQAKAKALAQSSSSSSLENKFTKLEIIENLDKDVKPLIAEYFANGDAKDVAQSLRKFDVKQRGGELIAYIVTMALEKSNVHKELISRLLHDLNSIILRSNDYTDGYNALLETLNDLSLDNPECSTDIGKFIARSIADKCIDNTNGKYFSQYKGNVKCPKMQAALDKAETLVSMGDFYFLNNVWNAQSSKFEKYLIDLILIYFFFQQNKRWLSTCSRISGSNECYYS